MMLGTVAGNVDDAAVFAEAPAKARPKPVNRADRSSGKMMRRKMVNCDAPSMLPASSYVGSSFSRTGWIERTTNGMPTKTMAMVRPILV